MAVVILPSKSGVSRTELVEGLRVVESYDPFCGRKRAVFVIVAPELPGRLRVADDGVPELVDKVPSKVEGDVSVSWEQA